MSLRWKLFRFLSAETIQTPSTDRPDPETPLFPSLALTHDEETKAARSLLVRFSAAADRSICSDAIHTIYVFALPRAVVQFFNFSTIEPNLALTAADTTASVRTPLQYTFAAHDVSVVSISLVPAAANALPWLVTLGIDDSAPTLKIWAFRQQFEDPTESLPSSYTSSRSIPAALTWTPANDDNRLECIALFRLNSDVRPTALTVLEASKASSFISQIAVGFDDGSVTVLCGDLCRERASRVRIAPAPGEMIEPKSIVFLRYCNNWLYCVSEISICVILPAPSRDEASAPSFRRHILDNLGVSRGELCCVMEESAELIVAKQEALYFFNRDGRGPCLAFPTEGRRASVTSAGSYVIHSSGPGSITAYDVVNKLIAYRGKGTVSASFHGQLHGIRQVLICVDQGSIIKLSEISLDERVNLLLKRGLYVSAVALARAETAKVPDSNKEILVRAIRQYAEYLMTKNRYDEAAEQLVETIGERVEPSWVISRLVEQSGLRSGLRLYLEALHAAGKAAFVHTKVLITCYRHDRARGAILGSKAIEKTTDEYVINVFSDVDWTEEQVDAAISLCRSAGLFKVAERLARRRGRFVQLALTLVEDLEEPNDALELLRSLPDAEALQVAKAIGRQMLVKNPDRFVHYLAEAISRSTAMMPVGVAEPTMQMQEFLPFFIDMPAWLAVLLERLVKTPRGLTAADAQKAWNLLFESLVCVDVRDRVYSMLSSSDRAERGKNTDLELASANHSTRAVLRPRDSLLHRTLERRERFPTGRRALKVLQSRRSVIDLRIALEIAEKYGHDPCLEYLYEHLRMYRELGICLRAGGNGTSLLRACRRHGDREAQLWIECIKLYAPLVARENEEEEEQADITEDIDATSMAPADTESVTSDESAMSRLTRDSETEKTSSQDVLDEAILALDRSGTMSPIEIVDIVVEACPDAEWGLIRDYFERCVATLRRDTATSEHNGMLLYTELQELRKEAKRLREDMIVIKPKSCASCEDPVTVPAVHFFCEHSFHATCLGPGGVGLSGTDLKRLAEGHGVGVTEDRSGAWGEECPKCAPELDGMVSMRQAIQEKNNRHEEFFGALKGSRDGLSTVIQFLERSPFI